MFHFELVEIQITVGAGKLVALHILKAKVLFHNSLKGHITAEEVHVQVWPADGADICKIMGHPRKQEI